jgi:hypothetical protein
LSFFFAIVFLPIGIDFFVAAQYRKVFLGHRVIWARHPTSHVHLAGDDIGNLPVAILADQFGLTPLPRTV